MKKLNSRGFKLSNADKKAFEHYLIETPEEWAQKALNGMINKAVKSILKDWLEAFKDKAIDSIPATYAELIPAIIAMEGFEPYKVKSSEKRKAQRDESQDIEIWATGFNIEDWKDSALKAYYLDPEQTLEDFMENKIALRKQAFAKEYEQQLLKDPETLTIPNRQDAMINLIVQKPGYKNRKASETEV